jgi:hypothetical protein
MEHIAQHLACASADPTLTMSGEYGHLSYWPQRLAAVERMKFPVVVGLDSTILVANHPRLPVAIVQAAVRLVVPRYPTSISSVSERMQGYARTFPCDVECAQNIRN